jgi:hypothetical protein
METKMKNSPIISAALILSITFNPVLVNAALSSDKEIQNSQKKGPIQPCQDLLCEKFICKADLNHDGKVDQRDVILWSIMSGLTPALDPGGIISNALESTVNPDINGDEIINSDDLQILLESMGCDNASAVQSEDAEMDNGQLYDLLQDTVGIIEARIKGELSVDEFAWEYEILSEELSDLLSESTDDQINYPGQELDLISRIIAVLIHQANSENNTGMKDSKLQAAEISNINGDNPDSELLPEQVPDKQDIPYNDLTQERVDGLFPEPTVDFEKGEAIDPLTDPLCQHTCRL